MGTCSIHDMTETEINALVFKDASAYEARGLLDGLTEKEILDMPDHPDWHVFTWSFQNWIFDAIDSLI